jgi:hypothetical protein
MADVLGFLRKGYPFIATALSLGGPAGNLAAAAVGKALSIEKASPDSIIKELGQNLSPEKIAALQQAEEELTLQLKQAGYQNVEDLEKIAAADRADAREREVKTGDRMTPRVLAGCMVVAWFAIEGFLLWEAFRGAPEPSSAMSQIVGAISRMADSAVTLVLGYYFGSSAGRDQHAAAELTKA